MTSEERRQKNKEAQRRYRATHAEKSKADRAAAMRRWREAHPEEAKAAQDKQRQARDPQKMKGYRKESFQRAKDELYDSYVARVLVARSSIAKEDVPPDLIELKRAVMTLRKLLKE